MALKATYKRMLKFSDINLVLNNILMSLEKRILKMNRDQMYEDGVMDIHNPGSILRYAPSTIKNKKGRAAYPRTDHITLKWEGDFHKDLKIKFGKDSFLIHSDDTKWNSYLKVQGRFENALGLTDESMSLLRDWVADKLIKQFRNAV